MSDAAMTRAREWLGECAIGGGWCDAHDRRPHHCTPLVEDLAAMLRQVAADAWDETAEEAYGCGWLHDQALADVKGRNPYRKDEAMLDSTMSLPIHRTEAGYPNCSTCDGGGCHDCTDPA